MIIPQKEETCAYCGEIIRRYEYLHHADKEYTQNDLAYCHEACCPICNERYAETDYIEEE